jgi:hypothetical protein
MKGKKEGVNKKLMNKIIKNKSIWKDMEKIQKWKSICE